MLRLSRYRFRFRLRALLLLLTVVACWLGYMVHSARKQQETVSAIKDFGGSVMYDFEVDESGWSIPNAQPWAPEWLLDFVGQDFFHRVVCLVFRESDTPVALEDNHELVRRLAQMNHVRIVDVSGHNATDATMRLVGGFSSLEHFRAYGATAITDDGVANLAGLRHLEYVILGNSQFTNSSHLSDASLQSLSSCPKLEVLLAQGHNFSDKGLEYLSNSSKLRRLWVTRGPTSCTDQGLVCLAKLTNLQELGLQGNGITDRGLVHMKRLASLKRVELVSDSITETAFSRLAGEMGGTKLSLKRVKHQRQW